MKKTTKQNGQHRHIPGKISAGSSGGGGAPDGSPSNLQDSLVDTGEDLSYGPGIVSKLRCRYLSLALRESRQQNSKQRLQRSTSLNTLLDRDDDEPDGDGEAELPEESVAISGQVRAKSTPPPILGAKPTPKPIQRPVSLGANGTVPPASTANPPNSAGGVDDSKSGAGNGGANGGGNRSRHFKRGNEVMKRARSVEALLCEKSPWNSQRSSSNIPPGSNAPAAKTMAANSPAASPTCVTIEDKIHNARERLHSGTDTAPPKRLASIIDDTERPPPDLVKQTLKMFEASANRRPRTAHRSNGVGGVASKVASYKSIIKEQKVAPTSVGFASSTPLRPVNHPDIIPRQADASMSTLSMMMMRRIDLPEEAEQPAQATPVAEELVAATIEASSETEERGGGGDEGDSGDVGVGGGGEGDDDNNEKHDNEGDDGDGDDDDGGDIGDDGEGENNEHQQLRSDKMGAAGDKPSPKSPATEAGGAQHRSFAPSTENVNVAAAAAAVASGGVTPVRKLNTESSSSSSTTKQIGVIRPLFNSQGITPPLTSREIEKNRINEMKKSTEAGGIGSGAGGSLGSPTTSLDTVINTKEPAASSSHMLHHHHHHLHHHHHHNQNQNQNQNNSETDATASPLWTLRKTRGQNQSGTGVGVTASSSHTATENSSMVFNFSKSTKEVPDYIESDVVIYRRKRELPKVSGVEVYLSLSLSVTVSVSGWTEEFFPLPPEEPVLAVLSQRRPCGLFILSNYPRNYNFFLFF